MLTLTNLPLRQIVLSFVAGVLLTALIALVVSALAQVQVPSPVPSPVPGINVQQMIEWCRQMMSQGSAMMQGMMSGACMGG